MTSLELTKGIVKILDNKKASDIVAAEIKGISTLGDYFVIASGTSATHVKALVDEIDERLSKDLGIEPKRIEGYQSASWILMDYYDVMVHIFHPETREFYSLERLWADAPKLDLSEIIK